MGNLLKHPSTPVEPPPLALPCPPEPDHDRVATLERTVEVLVASLIKKDRELRAERYAHNFSVFVVGFALCMLNDEDHMAVVDLRSDPQYMEIHQRADFNWSEVEPKLKKITTEHLNRRGKQ